MIDHRHLIKEIPSGKFHSVLMTSYSLSLYYWEIQLLHSLSAKGINYVSAIVDSDCLSEQLLKFSTALSEKRTLNFSLHGYKMKGSFHPKIQFYVGRDCVLVLIGSGNITISGHGRNLEVWSPVMVESTDNPAYPFVREVWSYLKRLYVELGEEATNIVATLERNCTLLQSEYVSVGTEFNLGASSIRFLANQDSSIFDQCKGWIGEEKIKRITIMSPFYDREANLIKALYEEYKPKEINVIIEEGFGMLPKSSSIPNYVKLYRWDKIEKIEGKKYQEFFHSKCIFFDGETNHYLLCGSANASVAAFGLPGVKPTNQEANVGFKSLNIDYFEQTGFKLIEPVAYSQIKDFNRPATATSVMPNVLWIKEASYFYKSFSLNINNPANDVDAVVSFYSGARKLQYSKNLIIKSGMSEIVGAFDEPSNPLYVEVVDNCGNLISNRQFVIPIERMDANNPSPESYYIRKRSYDIESGKFINGEILCFIERILNDSDKKLSQKTDKATVVKDRPLDNSGHEFDTLDDYFKNDGTSIIGGRKIRLAESANSNTSMLFDSIVSYIARSNKEKVEEEYDNEETEDYNSSEGKETRRVHNIPLRSIKNSESTQARVIKMFERYFDYLEKVAFADKPATNRIYLSKAIERFTTAVFFLHRVFSYRFTLEENSNEIHVLLNLQFKPLSHNNATEYFYKLISLFALYLKNSQFENENEYTEKKMESRRRYSFELCLAMMAICDWQNEGNKEYEKLSSMYRLPAMLNIAKALKVDFDSNIVNNSFKCFDRDIQELDGFDKSNMLNYISSNIGDMLNSTVLYPNGNLLFTEEFGYVRLSAANEFGAYPCSMAFRYDYTKKQYCSNFLFLYSKERIYPIKPPK